MPSRPNGSSAMRLFLCGDVMTGRGIDQILPHSCDPRLHEPWVSDARHYVDLAEAEPGPIPRSVSHDYVWGDALGWLKRFAPDHRLINLETAITCDGEPWPGKDVHYRMHPGNARLLTAAGIDCCTLANNHVLDWGLAGLDETLASIEKAGVATAGAGESLAAAQAPVVLTTPGKGRLILFGVGAGSSGIPPDWAAEPDRPGVWRISEAAERSVAAVAEQVEAIKGEGDVVVVSIHWGSNWGYEVPDVQRELAHALIDRAGVDLIHGHSSHHVKGAEIHRGKLILYGCGDFLNDYEGIGGYGHYRDDLTLMYFCDLDPATGKVLAAALRPMQIHRFQVVDAGSRDARWLGDLLARQDRTPGADVRLTRDGTLRLQPY